METDPDLKLIKIEDLELPGGLGRMLTTLFNQAATEYQQLVDQFVSQYETKIGPDTFIHPAILEFERKHLERYKAMFVLPTDKEQLVGLFKEARALDEAGNATQKTTMYFFARQAVNNVLASRDSDYRIY